MTAAPRTLALARPVRAVKVYSRPTIGAWVPTFERVEPDFEPLPEGSVPFCELACTAEPEPAAEHEEALVRGVMREPAAEKVRTRRPAVAIPSMPGSWCAPPRGTGP
ncbi:hypothetical protein ACWD4L_29390 [Streptomyces sp. NPDC002596]|uniref:hypothetical protein n=1 Tax=unclassified Streptomyces TaxID=2593676 RepID=UPI0035D7E8FF